jgi:hypothetical protein
MREIDDQGNIYVTNSYNPPVDGVSFSVSKLNAVGETLWTSEPFPDQPNRYGTISVADDGRVYAASVYQ